MPSKRLPRKSREQKARFQAALKLAGMTAKDFATSRSVSAAHLSYVLNRQRESQRLETEIEEFTQKYLVDAVLSVN